MDQLGFCWSHSKASAEERKQIASAGGKSGSRRSPDELERVKREIRGVTAKVLTGEVERGTGAVVLQGMNTFLRAMEVQRKLDHQQELEDQVAELRERLEEIKRSRRLHGSA